MSEKVVNHASQLNSLKTDNFKLKEENATQQEQIHELRAQLQATRDAAAKVQSEQASTIQALTAEVRASADKIAALSKSHSAATQQLDTLTKQEAARGSPALRAAPPPAVSSSPYIRAVQPASGPFEIQWPGGSAPTSSAPSPMIHSIISHAPGSILPPPPMQGDMLWSSAPQQIIFR